MSLVIPSVFCSPGEEWEPPASDGNQGGISFSGKAKIVEWPLIFLINLFMGAILVVLFVMIYYMVDAMLHPIEYALKVLVSTFESLL